MTTGVQNIHVSQEEYSQTMHDAVNSYYAHTMNDPTMSQDEARETTAAMAERALDAVDEFAANEAAANEAEPAAAEAYAIDGQEAGAETGTDEGSGLGGEDGEGGQGDSGIE